jgi:Peptidase A4 family
MGEYNPRGLGEPRRFHWGWLVVASVVAFLCGLLLFVLLFSVFPVFFAFPGSSSGGVTSTDWGGFVVGSDVNNPVSAVSGVNGSWVVPTVNALAGDGFSAVWVGVGGFFDDSLIQIGTEQDVVGGVAVYSAWYELLPSTAVTVGSISVSAGDSLFASVTLADASSKTWLISIVDVSSGQSFSKSLVYDSGMLSGEWVVERPTVGNRIGGLADFGAVTFTGCSATLSGTSGAISKFDHADVTMVNRQNVELVTVSSLSSDGTSFTANYQTS